MEPERTSAFQEAVRKVSISYPIPFMLALLLGFALGCFGIAPFAPASLGWLIGGVGAAGALAVVGLSGYAVLKAPELLRSEHHTLLYRYMDWLDNSDTDPAVQERLGKLIGGTAETPQAKKQVVQRHKPGGNRNG